MRVVLKGILSSKKRLADGSTRVYYYAWRGGPPLAGKPGSAEFIASYNEAVKDRATPPADRFASLTAAYKDSTEFTTLGQRTRADYLKQLAKIETEFGHAPVSALTSPRARAVFKMWRDRLARKSLRQADYAWTVLARVFSVAKDRGKIDVNPCEKGGRLYKADRSDAVWTDDNEAQFLKLAPPHLHLALLLGLWTGQRQGDLLRLTWSNYDGTTIRLRQGKTRRRISIRVAEPLKAALDAEKARKRGLAILLTIAGEPWTEDGFHTSWRKACGKAGIKGLTFHDIRGTAITRLALSGASVAEIATLTGHALKDVEAILDAHYLSRDVALGDSAVTKMEVHRLGAKTEQK